MNKADREFLIWFAGFFEGEGAFTVYPWGRGYLGINQSVKNHGERITKDLKKRFGGSALKVIGSGYSGKTEYWGWRLGNSRKIFDLLSACLGFFKIRKVEFVKKLRKMKRVCFRKCVICGKTFWRHSGNPSGNAVCSKRSCKTKNTEATLRKYREQKRNK